MKRWIWLVGALPVLAVLLAGTSVFAQTGGGTGTLNGVVVDKDGGVIPGATVVIKDKATSRETTLVTNGSGAYSAPGIPIGLYSITVSLTGFKTAVVDDMRLTSGAVITVPKTVLQVGALTETVKVQANTELVHTQQTQVTSTVTGEEIANLPVVSRNALNFVTFLPNVQTPGTGRASTVAGLPQSAINISIDGVTTSNLLQSNDGFFSMVTPRLDAVEEVSVSVAGAGADASAEGAVQIKFVTKSGTNQYRGTAYDSTRDPRFNTNYFFNTVNNLPKNVVKVDQYGGSEGGPIVVPGLVDGHGKAFFFFNMEVLHQPSSITRTRTILTPEAMQGIVSYPVAGGGRQSVNLFALAAASGNPAIIANNNPDPTITALLAKIQASTQTQGNVTPATATSATGFSTNQYLWQPTSMGNQYSPTTKIDVNLSPSQRLSGSYWLQRFKSDPDLLNSVEPSFPGFLNQGQQHSYRTFGQMTLRSTLGKSMVNTLLGGWQTSPNDFFSNITADMFADQTPPGSPNSFSLGLPLITGATATRNAQPRNTPNWQINDDFSWLKGSHSLAFGGNFTRIINTQNSYDVAASLSLGFDTTNDPAAALFVPANFPGITSSSDSALSTARSLYGLLTGRVTQITCTARLNDAGTAYQYCGPLQQRAKDSEFGAYLQDAWRVSPTLTVNGGVRWDVLLPFTAITANYTMSDMNDLCGVSGLAPVPRVDGRQCNLFQPGTLYNPGAVPQFVAYDPGHPGFQTNWTEFAPSVGIAWRPNAQHGFMRRILGDPDQALIRGSYNLSFNQPRMDSFTGVFGSNPGGTAPSGATRGLSAGNFPLYTGGSAPLLLSQSTLLGQPDFTPAPAYPIVASTGNSIRIFDPNIKIPTVHAYSIGLQRAVGKDLAIEARYTGNRANNTWTTENWNAQNIYENGFLQEFQAAQGNLAANVAAGKGGTFAYTGAPGTVPLPIYLAYATGNPASVANDPTKYTGTTWTNSTFVNQLDYWFPAPSNAANSLWTSTNGRANGAKAGLASNFFVVNPAVSAAQITRSAAKTYYNSFTFEVRRRLSRGLQVDSNYTYGNSWGSSLQDLHYDRVLLQNTGVPHALKTTFDYQLPVGRGRRFGQNMNSLVDGLIGGWEVAGTWRFQTNSFLFRGILHNLTKQELQNDFHIRMVTNPDTGVLQVFDMPEDIVTNTQKAYATSASSATGYGSLGPPDPNSKYLGPAGGPGCFYQFIGDCGEQSVFINGPAFSRVDLTVKKRFALGGRREALVQFDLLNAFDNINFNHSLNPDPGGSNLPFQVTSAYQDTNGTFDPGGRLGQLSLRFNW